MSRNFPGNSQMQKFWEENYDKERDARIAWFQRLKTDPDIKTGSQQLEVFKKRIEAGCPKPTESLLQLRKSLKEKNHHKQKVTYDGNLAGFRSNLKHVDSKMLIRMYPVKDDETKSLLYDGFTKEGKGRYQYLRRRYQTAIPEEKYQFPLLSSWEYGWRLGDVINKDEIKKPDHGRTRIVNDTFYSRCGVPSMRSSVY